MSKTKYTEDFKKEVAEATLEEGMSLAKVGKKFNVHPTLVRNWRLKFIKSDESKDSGSSDGGLTIDDVKNETDTFYKLSRDLEDLCGHMKDWFDGRGEDFFGTLPSGANGVLWQDLQTEDNKFILKTTIYSNDGSEAMFDEEEFVSMIKEEWKDEYKTTFDRYGLSMDQMTWITEITDEEVF